MVDAETQRIEALLAEAGRLRSIARAVVGVGADPEDMVQESFAYALERPPRGADNLGAWMGAVVRSVARQFNRAETRRRRRERGAIRSEAAPGPVEALARAEVRQRVVQAVLELREPGRTAILLRFFEEWKPGKIARHLGVPASTVRSRIHRALADLRRRLDTGDAEERRALWLSLGGLAGRRGGALGLATKGVLMASKPKVIALAAVALLVAGGILVLKPGDGASEPERPAGGRSLAAEPDAGRQDAEPVLIGGAVRGRVVDENGGGVAGVGVWVRPAEGGGGDAQTVQSGEDGSFECADLGNGEVELAALPSAGFEPDPGEGLRATPPAEGLVLTGRRFPVGTVVAQVIDRATGAPLERFRVMVSLPSGGWVGGYAAGGPKTIPVRLPPDSRDAVVTVRLDYPKSSAEVSREILLRAGDRTEVELVFDGGSGETQVEGQVLDGDGRAVEGAVAYLGNRIRARGDEPFKPFDPRRVPDAVTTGADGRFRLAGVGREVTIWHPDFTPRTVPAGQAGAVTLAPRGAIHGRVVDASGQPLANVQIALERTRTATTNDQGRFAFESVEGGVAGLVLPGKRYVAVRVQPGRSTEATIGPGLDRVRIRMSAGGGAFGFPAESKMAMLIGLDEVSALVPVNPSAGQTEFEVRGVLPGRYLLLISTGHATVLDVQAAKAVADFGSGALTVRGPAGTPIYAVPAGDEDELVRLLAGRIVMLDMPASEEIRIAPVPTGRWLVGLDETVGRDVSRAVEKTVDVEGTSAEVDLTR